jgi:hypothetical protein
MDGADDDAISLSHMNSPKVDMVMALLGYAKKDRLSAQNSPADSAACMFHLHVLKGIVVSLMAVPHGFSYLKVREG